MRQLKLVFMLILVLLGGTLLISCNSMTNEFINPGDSLDGGGIVDIPETDSIEVIYDFDTENSNFDVNVSWTSDDPIITLDDDNSYFTDGANGIEIVGNIIYITETGTYVLEGALNDGRIVIQVDGQVHLIFNGVSITSSDGVPLVILGSKKKVITLVEGTSNYLEDATSYSVFYDDEASEPNGALFSKKALTINGGGSLEIVGNYNNGISVKDELRILDSAVTIYAVNNGIKGNDQVIIKNSDITIVSENDGIKSDKESDTTGFVYFNDSYVTIDAKGDGIQAYNLILIDNGTFNIITFNGSQSSISTEDSAKGLKSDGDIIINDGSFNLDTYDDSIHAANIIQINGGVFNITTNDDAIHSDYIVEVNDGTLDITQSYEGIEAARIYIHGGQIYITSSDDGINAADDTDNAVGFINNNCMIIITGGYIEIYASGDGIDSNGTVLITGGTLLVHGPTASGDSALDADGGILVNGGYLVATGSLGMVETPGANSEQNVVSIAFSSRRTANQLIELKDVSNNVIISFTPSKTYQSLIISVPELTLGSTYTISIDGSNVTSFTQTQTIVYIGSSFNRR